MDIEELGKMSGCSGESVRFRRASWVLGTLWLGVAGFAIAGKLGEYWWWFDLASHFRVQYFVVALSLCGAALLARCWVWAGAACGLAAILGATLVPFWSGADATLAGSERLRILSVNVLSSNSRSDLFRKVVTEQSPDLVVLLEFSKEWEEALAWMEAEYPHRCVEPRRGNFGMGVYSRRPLSRVRVLNLGDEGPLCIAVDVDLAGRPLTVWGVHTYPPVSREATAARNMHMSRLAQYVCDDQADCVVVGDLNCTSWSPWFVNFTERTGLRDSRLGRGVQATWPVEPIWLSPLRIPIDHCLVSPDVGVAMRRVTAGLGSDHLGVVADIGWQTEGPQTDGWGAASKREESKVSENGK